MDNSPDWSLISAFLAVAETGSLSAAARQIGASQPTLGRRIAALEAQLGAELFRRHARGFELTDVGAALMPDAEAIRDAMGRITLTAAGEGQEISGTVRITASDMLSYFHLPPIIAALRRAEPAIEIELVPSDATSNLLFREADIAIRMYRPTQLDLVTRHLGDIELCALAARSYLDAHGRPQSAADLMNHQVVGYDANADIAAGFKVAGMPVQRDWFAVRCDDNLAYWALVRAGCGIGFGQRVIAARYDDIEVLDFGLELPRLPVWLTAHEAMRRAPRVRRVWDHLAAGLAPLCAPA